MQAIVEVQVVPIGSGTSMRHEVALACQSLRDAGLRVHQHATGTNVEGEVTEVLQAVGAMLRKLHAEGVLRIATTITIDTRSDRQPPSDEDASAS